MHLSRPLDGETEAELSRVFREGTTQASSVALEVSENGRTLRVERGEARDILGRILEKHGIRCSSCLD